MKRIENIDINNHWISCEITINNINDIKTTVPRQPGLYLIFTDTPKDELKKHGKRNDRMHYNLKSKIEASENIPNDLIINQKNDELYCVYNGHHYNLRQRLSEHFNGSKGTGCLALFEIEELREFKWTFKYLLLSKTENYIDSKVYRTLLEQQIRVKLGWPILCTQ